MFNSPEESLIFADLSLARRLERAEAHSNAEFVEARAKLSPEVGAGWIEVAGAYAMFDGRDSPLTQTFGLGMFQPAAAAHLEKIEEFYKARSAPVFHEVSPLADSALFTLLNERGYHPFEFTSVMYRPIKRAVNNVGINDKIRVHIIGESGRELWAQTAAQGWSEFPELSQFMLALSEISVMRPSAYSFLAMLEVEPIAAGAISICEGVALLAGASTVPARRKLGAQRALLAARLNFAAQQGCDIAMMCALPGSASQRNAERQGFKIAYTRIKWRES